MLLNVSKSFDRVRGRLALGHHGVCPGPAGLPGAGPAKRRQRQPAGTRPRQVKDAIIARRGPDVRGIAKTAAARVMLTQVFYGMRDGHIRRATSQAA